MVSINRAALMAALGKALGVAPPALPRRDRMQLFVGSPRFRGKYGRRNPAGSKLLRTFYKAKTGERGTYAQALDWYRRQQGETVNHKDHALRQLRAEMEQAA